MGELEQMVSEDVPLDHRVHARIIGARGKAIRKIMDEFKVCFQPLCEGCMLVLEAPWMRWMYSLVSELSSWAVEGHQDLSLPDV